MRAVLDPNIVISALLSPTGAPARTLVSWQDGQFELVASPQLLAELERALAYPKLRQRISADQAAIALDWIAREALMADDVRDPPKRSRDPDDDYPVALAERTRAALVTGDADLLVLREELPIFSAADFLRWLQAADRNG